MDAHLLKLANKPNNHSDNLDLMIAISGFGTSLLENCHSNQRKISKKENG
jgi:hypothetical protein